MDEGIRRACATHPERLASITCKHCGSYACSECTIDKLWGETLCVACDERGTAQYPIPWERSIGPGSFIATTRVVFSELRLVFSAFPQGSVARAFAYAMLMGAALIAAIGLAAALNARTHAGLPLSATLGLYAIVHVASTISAGVGFYLAQTVLRGRAALGMCLRASAYLTGLDFMFVAAMFMPGALGWAVIVAATSMWIWGWTLLAQGRAGLSRGRALAAAIAVLIISLVGSIVPAMLAAAVYAAIFGRSH